MYWSCRHVASDAQCALLDTCLSTFEGSSSSIPAVSHLDNTYRCTPNTLPQPILQPSSCQRKIIGLIRVGRSYEQSVTVSVQLTQLTQPCSARQFSLCATQQSPAASRLSTQDLESSLAHTQASATDYSGWLCLLRCSSNHKCVVTRTAAVRSTAYPMTVQQCSRLYTDSSERTGPGDQHVQLRQRGS